MMSNARRKDLAPRALALLVALTLAGCASAFDVLPEKLGGLPANAPARQAETAAYPNVYEPMAPRDVKPLSEDEQKTLGRELLSLRESQTLRANPPPPEPVRKNPTATKQQPKQQPKKQAAKKAPDTKAAEKKAADKPPN
jgi:hypothetical protein